MSPLSPQAPVPEAPPSPGDGSETEGPRKGEEEEGPGGEREPEAEGPLARDERGERPVSPCPPLMSPRTQVPESPLPPPAGTEVEKPPRGEKGDEKPPEEEPKERPGDPDPKRGTWGRGLAVGAGPGRVITHPGVWPSQIGGEA